MSTVEKSIRLYAWRTNYHTFRIVEGEVNSRIFNIQLFGTTIPVNLANCHVSLYAVKPDSTKSYIDCEILDAELGLVRVTLTDQIASVQGLVDCWIQVVGDAGTDLRFEGMNIEVSDCDLSEAVESSDEFPVLLTALSEVRPATARANDAADRANKASENADTATAGANNAKNEALATKEQLIKERDAGVFDGKAGARGPAGVDGKDYILSDVDISEIARRVENIQVVNPPTCVDSVAKMTDTSKTYVLRDTGTIFAYMDSTTQKKEHHVIPIEGVSGNDYQEGCRWGSSDGAINNDAAGYHLTPKIDLTKPEYQGKTLTIYLDGCQYSSTGAYAQWIQCRVWDTSGNVVGARVYTGDDTFDSFFAHVQNGSLVHNSTTSTTITFEIPPLYGTSLIPIGAIAFCGKGSKLNSKIRIEYDSFETVTGFQWTDTGIKFAPVLTLEEKKKLANEIIELVDTDLLSLVGTGEVTL